MSSGDLEKQEPLLCWQMTQNQVYKGGGEEMEESKRKTLTQVSRQKALLSVDSYLTHTAELSQSLQNCTEPFPLTWLIHFITTLQKGL